MGRKGVRNWVTIESKASDPKPLRHQIRRLKASVAYVGSCRELISDPFNRSILGPGMELKWAPGTAHHRQGKGQGKAKQDTAKGNARQFKAGQGAMQGNAMQVEATQGKARGKAPALPLALLCSTQLR